MRNYYEPDQQADIEKKRIWENMGNHGICVRFIKRLK